MPVTVYVQDYPRDAVAVSRRRGPAWDGRYIPTPEESRAEQAANDNIVKERAARARVRVGGKLPKRLGWLAVPVVFDLITRLPGLYARYRLWSYQVDPQYWNQVCRDGYGTKRFAGWMSTNCSGQHGFYQVGQDRSGLALNATTTNARLTESHQTGSAYPYIHDVDALYERKAGAPSPTPVHAAPWVGVYAPPVIRVQPGYAYEVAPQTEIDPNVLRRSPGVELPGDGMANPMPPGVDISERPDPPWKVEIIHVPRVPPAPRPVPNPPSPPAPPPLPPAGRRPPRGKREKERKVYGRKPLVRLIRAIDFVSEAAEVVDAFYDALPRDVRKRWERGRKDRGLTDTAGQYGIDGADWKLQALYYNWHKVSLPDALLKTLLNHYEDKAIGGLMRKLPRNIGRVGDPIPEALGGLF